MAERVLSLSPGTQASSVSNLHANCAFGGAQGKEKLTLQVKASQCFTKYRWRTTEEAARDNGPEIVATQVVSDYLTPYDGEMLMMQAKDKPVVKYTYRMTFRYGSSMLLAQSQRVQPQFA